MKKIFRDNDNQLRSGWKIIGVIGLSIIIGIVGQFVYTLLASFFAFGKLSSAEMANTSISELRAYLSDYMYSNEYIAWGVENLYSICLILSTYIFLRKFDKKNFKDIGFISLKLAHKELCYGSLLGIASAILIYFSLLITKNIGLVGRLSEPSFSKYTYISLISVIIGGISMEIFLRGYCITTLNRMNKPVLSIITSSIIFAFLNLFNYDINLLGFINTFLVSILLGYMFIKTKNIWMSIGYIIVWNYVQGNIFGLPVSGTSYYALYETIILKDNILTGGNYGPEAGALTTIIIILGLIIVNKFPASSKVKSVITGSSVD